MVDRTVKPVAFSSAAAAAPGSLCGAFARLAAARARAAAQRVAAGAWTAVAAAPAAAVLAAWAAHDSQLRPGLAGLVAFAVAATAAAPAAAWAAASRWRRAGRSAATAAAAWPAALRLASGATASASLAPLRGDWREAAYALSMVGDAESGLALPQAHLAQWAARADELRPAPAALPHPWRWARWSAFALSVVGVSGLHGARTRAWARVCGRPVVTLAAGPLTADWRLVVVPPAYTGQPPAAPPFSNGDVAALYGSQLDVAVALDRPWRRVEAWAFADGKHASDGSPPVAKVPAAVTGRRATVSLGVTAPIHWAFVVSDDDENWLQEPSAHALRVNFDAPPQATLLAPAADALWARRGRMRVQYLATDDFGVVGARFCLAWAGGVSIQPPRCVPLPWALEPSANPNFEPGALASRREPSAVRGGGSGWVEMADLVPEGRPPGEEGLEAFVEAWDNDPAFGPKVGRSAVVSLWFDDPQSAHERSLVAAREAQEAMVDWLGSAWATGAAPTGAPPPSSTLRQAIAVATAAAQAADDASQDDELALPIERTTIRTALALCTQAGAAAPGVDVDPGQRRLQAVVLAFDDLFASRRRALAQDHAALAQAETTSLQAMLQGPGALNAAAVRKQMDAIKAALAQYIQQLQQAQPQLAEAPAVDHSEQRGAFDDAISRIEAALANGDRAAAAGELQALQQRLEAQQKQSAEAEDQQRDPLDEKIAAAMAELHKQAQATSAMQAELAEHIRAAQSASASAPAPSASALQAWRQAHAAALQALAAAEAPSMLQAVVRPPVEAMGSLVQQANSLVAGGALLEAGQATQRAQRDAHALHDRLPKSALTPMLNAGGEATQAAYAAVGQLPLRMGALLRAIAGLQQAAQRNAAPAKHPEANELQQKQRTVWEQAQQLAKTLGALHEQQPMLPAAHPELQRAAHAAQTAMQALQQGSVEAALTPANEATAAFAAFVADLQAQQQSSAGAGGRPSPMPGATPTPAPGRASRGPGGRDESPAGSKRPGRKPGGKPSDGRPQPADKRPQAGTGPSSEGSAGASGEVAIPGFDARRDPAPFRERVLKASQDRPPAQFEEPVREYYRELLQ